jgi:CheY-like chemotaxis protein
MRKILLVDDMAVIRDPLSIVLRQRGYQVVCAANGQEALDLLPVVEPDLVLLDVSMPVMDGLTFLRLVRADPSRRHLPVIVMTANTNRDGVFEAYRLGARGYVHKAEISLPAFWACIDRGFVNATEASAQSAA